MMYYALYSGYEVDVRSKAHWFKIKVEEGVRGIRIPVVASRLDDGTWQIMFQEKYLTVVSVEQIV